MEKKVRTYNLLILFIFPGCVFGADVNTLGKINVTSNQSTVKAVSNGVYASGDTFGMRSNAVIAAFSANPDSKFNYPIVGFSYLMQMGKYLDRDSVGLYADNTSSPYKRWEIVHNVTYTPTSFSAKAYDLINIKPGMLIDTVNTPKWSSYVVAVQDRKVITAGWVNTKTGHLGTPDNGIDLVINPITKIWATNFNIFLQKNGRVSKSVIQENALVNNNITDPQYVNGIDTVILPQSKFGGTASFLSRSANSGEKQQWKYGFLSLGAINSFVSSDTGDRSPEISFHDTSTSANGMVFEGRNKANSILWKKEGKVTAAITPDGLISRYGMLTSLIKNDTALSTDFSRYIFNNDKVIDITLPPEKDITSGYTIKLVKTTNYDIIIKSSDETKINKNDSLKVNGVWTKDIFFFNGEWYFY
ncbi:hypothetical protein [Ewingella americana]|uniref:Uncharacterized protein n=1 Tax=Ewingella americana TaxID=41202 RepID=A0A502GQA4_9GAMM|nr:hypothetical protein [Ewingella americana]TPG64081.1 hypothetical protein EAH77_04450 [Ewingella americana]